MHSGIRPVNMVSEECFLNKLSGSLVPASVKLEQIDSIMMESQVQNELESHEMPDLKRFRMMEFTPSENSCSSVSIGITSPLSPDLSSFSSFNEYIPGNIGLMLSAMPESQSFGKSPPPLGLHLRKSPSLVELIERKLAQGDMASPENSEAVTQSTNKGKKSNTLLNCQQDKLKASNFSAMVLRIGTWEFTSKHEGDLVAKFYYAKRKIVWEILDNRLKSKIEITWSEIASLKARFQENQSDLLEIEVSRSPSFFREIDPQPKKHTLWQIASDFTGGQATNCKRHYMQCSSGLLNRHFEKLLQCDARLKSLSEGFHEHAFRSPLHNEMHSVVHYDAPVNKYVPSSFCFQPLPGNTTVADGRMPRHQTGPVLKLEPVGMEDTMTEWAPRVAPSGQWHSNSMSTETGGFQPTKRISRGEANLIDESSGSVTLDQRHPSSVLFQPTLETQRSFVSGERQPPNLKILDDISRILLEEPYKHSSVLAGSVVLSSAQPGTFQFFR